MQLLLIANVDVKKAVANARSGTTSESRIGLRFARAMIAMTPIAISS